MPCYCMLLIVILKFKYNGLKLRKKECIHEGSKLAVINHNKLKKKIMEPKDRLNNTSFVIPSCDIISK